MRYEPFIAFRYLKSSRRSFLSTITAISAVGVVLAVTALTSVVSVMGGFQKAYRERLLGVYPHLIVYSRDNRFVDYEQVAAVIDQIEGVSDASPFVKQPLMIYTAHARAMIRSRGIDAEGLAGSGLDEYIEEGSLVDLSYDPLQPGENTAGIILGRELARRLNVEVGGNVVVVSHLRGVGPSLGPSQMAPTSETFQVVGIFEVGFNELDSYLALTDLEAMQSFLNRGNVVTGIDVRVDDIFATAAIAQEITARLPAGLYIPYTWQEMHRNLFESLKIQKFWLSLIMSILVIVACFNIVSTLVLMVKDKTKEVAVLKSIGASSWGIMKVFMIQGLVIGGGGTLLGLLGGLGVCTIIEHIDYGLDPSVYKISALAVDIRPTELIMIGLVSVAISFLATLFPAWRAGHMSPVEGLRYD